MTKDVRWKQRFENFEKPFTDLLELQDLKITKKVERAGYIKTFEISFELAWKTLKDYLEIEGISASSPRMTIKEAFKAGYIQNGDKWIDALEKRNLLAHTYNEALAEQAYELIHNKYANFLKDFYSEFKEKI